MKKLYFIPILLIIKFSSAQSNQWSKLGTNFNGRIIAVTADKTGNIYAAGAFTNLAGKQYVAKWNGTNWSELGTGIDTLNAIGPISNLCFDVSGNLYAAMSLMDSQKKFF